MSEQRKDEFKPLDLVMNKQYDGLVTCPGCTLPFSQ